LPEACVSVLGDTHARRITTMVSDVVEHSRDRATITMGEDVQEATNCLKDFLFDRVYLAGAAEDREHVERVIGALFRFYMEHSEEVPGIAGNEIATPAAALLRSRSRCAPAPVGAGAARNDSEATAVQDQRWLARLVCDHVAGMTDRFASQQFLQFYLPRRWWREV